MSPILLVVIGLIALAVGIGVASWLARANPTRIAKALRWTALAVAVVVVGVVLLRVTGPQFLPLVLLFGLPFLIRWLARLRPRALGSGTPRGGAAGTESNVETAYLRMALDHESGAMRGEVLRGRFAGRALGTLGLDDLLALRAECEHDDPPSVRLIENYLDRSFGTDWRTRPSGADDSGKSRTAGEPPDRTEMTRGEALELLGLEKGADHDAVLSAWRRLIKLNHPDHGGSKYIAAKLNEAKRVLLGE